MPLIEEEQPHPRRRLLALGIPAFLIALVVSLMFHQYAHVAVSRSACGGSGTRFVPAVMMDGYHADCPVASLAGPAATFGLALLSFSLYMRFPGSLFFGSMAFINATMRLPETAWTFFQLLLNQKTDLKVDESAALQMLRLHDPAVGIVLLCFFSLVLLFLSVIIIHDTRKVPSKWLVALGCFIVMFPLEHLAWGWIVTLVH